VKGALIEETYTVFSQWDYDRSKRENLDILRSKNSIGARSATWLEDVAKVLNRRFEPQDRDWALVHLAKAGCSLDEWKPLLLWHMTREEFLVRDFMQNWLFTAYESGKFQIRSRDVEPYLADIGRRGGVTEHAWSEATIRRVASGLLTIAADFGLIRGGATKEFISYQLPEHSFLYLLHAFREDKQSPGKIIAAQDWRLFLMHPSDVEQELLRLHQFSKLDYQVAGSIVQLTLPCASSRGYVESLVP
jgi:hypothetical protein